MKLKALFLGAILALSPVVASAHPADFDTATRICVQTDFYERYHPRYGLVWVEYCNKFVMRRNGYDRHYQRHEYYRYPNRVWYWYDRYQFHDRHRHH